MTKLTDVKCIGCSKAERGEIATLKMGAHNTTWLRPPKTWWVIAIQLPEGTTTIAACDVCMKIGKWTPPETVLKPADT